MRYPQISQGPEYSVKMVQLLARVISSGLTSNMPYMRQKAIRDMKLIVMEYDFNCGLLNLAQYQRLVSFQLYVN